MIKKMYANPKHEIQAQVLTDEKCENTGNIKPVWVTDRDPFENVRKIEAKKEGVVLNNNQRFKHYYNVYQALKKDLIAVEEQLNEKH